MYAEQQSRPAMMRRCLHLWRQTAAATKQWLAGVQSARLLARGFSAWQHYLRVIVACQSCNAAVVGYGWNESRILYWLACQGQIPVLFSDHTADLVRYGRQCTCLSDLVGKQVLGQFPSCVHPSDTVTCGEGCFACLQAETLRHCQLLQLQQRHSQALMRPCFQAWRYRCIRQALQASAVHCCRFNPHPLTPLPHCWNTVSLKTAIAVPLLLILHDYICVVPLACQLPSIGVSTAPLVLIGPSSAHWPACCTPSV